MDDRKPIFHKKLVRFVKKLQVLLIRENVLVFSVIQFYGYLYISARKIIAAKNLLVLEKQLK